MNTVGEREIRTQKRVIAFFEDALGYTYLGNWEHSGEDNSNILSEDLADWLRRQGYQNAIISKAVYELQKSAALGSTINPLLKQTETYTRQLRYGVNVQTQHR